MNRRQFMLAAGASATAALAGCTGRAVQDDDESGETDGSSERSIRVAASGEAEADPDQAVIVVGVEASGEEAAAVRAELADGIANLKEALMDAGIEEDAITTARFDIRENYDGPGYRGIHSYRVEVADVDAVGEILDTAVRAGADDVGRVQFTLTDETRAELREQAIADALANADDEAAFIAENRGQTLGETRSISTGDVGYSPVNRNYLAAESADAGSAETELESGPVTVTAQVEVVYDIE